MTQSSASPRTDASADDTHCDEPFSMRAERLDMLFAATRLGIGDCPTWIVHALEAEERADPKPRAEN